MHKMGLIWGKKEDSGFLKIRKNDRGTGYHLKVIIVTKNIVILWLIDWNFLKKKA